MEGERFIAKKIMTITNIFHSSDISCETSIGANFRFGHGGIGIVIHSNSQIGDNCYIMHGVTIGGKDGAYPIIENNVTICTNSVVLGKVKISSNSIIGALSFVNKDIPSNCVAAGIPAHKIRQLNKGDNK